MREGHGPVQTWFTMKQLLRGRFFPLDYEHYFFFMLIKYIHMIIGK